MVVTTAGSRAEGVAQTGQFAVGVFDLDLGDGNGVEVATHLLASGQVSRCIFFSGGASAPVMARARALGPLVSKGDGIQTLVAEVARLVGGFGDSDRRIA
jgi:DNA-binding NarL/FixJ family response regulator